MPGTLEAYSLRKTYLGREVLSGVSLSLSEGRILGLLGPSGSGKSTAFRLLTGVELAEPGSVFLDRKDISQVSIDARARLGIGYVPQAPDLYLSLSASDNFRIALEACRYTRPKAQAVLDDICRLLELDDIMDMQAGHLSGGQRKLIEIGFALCAQPRMLLLDEPFAKLDPITVTRIAGHIKRLANSGVGVLVTDHQARTVFSLAEEIVVINNGLMIAKGPSSEVIGSTAVRESFLGETFSP
ncbi:MAG: ATP-binding cassette domain-containing protein [Hoeflea sp.]|uniref:ATP-binding cassette domain-containing protein n=1 Tax=Hoeflea sp. TaxID=1940281 RepID=UPI001D2A76E4|nr:ATP-binding cassette domain-containing protein [Hoeflea sp.]MBU4530968.1 ATP-binding cassette domain-containing protein [Alphaproteobacteria bacterium]MBU4542743.1 ATP-binding cassette domain-containing protein [Alphaproteobacteria bacterium]MBU4552555.1 ATP-binding cassette domain-containing protein [Alphaproteobacteria bacterium]MBV1722860.1 ATP-binding cassette domain-containing protein [Hoeflea sp.]MBV1762771.1 ATP-binding cassette domain-containing protein [Hoeflea sp.]